METSGYTLMVCQDCYVTHHYGATEREGQWFAGDSDTPAVRKPLGEVADDVQLADYTCGDHHGTDDTVCGGCGRDGYDDGREDFSWAACEGCGTGLGGERFALWAYERAYVSSLATRRNLFDGGTLDTYTRTLR